MDRIKVISALAAALLAACAQKPANLNFALAGDAADGTINAGDELDYTYKVTDAQNKPVDNKIEVIPAAPGALVFDDGISGQGVIMGLTHVGTFTITARAEGAADVSQKVTVTVGPAAGPRSMTLGLTLERMATGDTTNALTKVVDVFDNVLINDSTGTAAGLTLDCTPMDAATAATACARAGNAFTVSKAGVYKITATFADAPNPSVSESKYVYVEDVADVIAPTATITGIIYPGSTVQVPRNTNSRIEVAVTFTDNKGLASAILYALFGNNPACIANSGLLLLTGGTNVQTNASVRLPACAFPYDAIGLFALVTDEAGNQGFSPINTSLTVSAAGLGTLTPGTGFTPHVVGIGNNGGGGGGQVLGGSTDIAWDPLAQIAYVVSNGNQRIGALLPDRTQASLRDILGNTYQPNAPTGIALTPAGELFINHFSNTGIGYIPPSLPTNPQTFVNNLQGPGRLVYDSRAKQLCVAKSSTNLTMNCYPFDSASPAMAPTKTFATDMVPAGVTTGELAGITVGAAAGGTYTVWMVYANCAVYTFTTDFTATAPSAPTQVTLSPALNGGATCQDIAALPSGNVALLVNGTTVDSVTPGGAVTNIIGGLNQATGLDFAGGDLFVLDPGVPVALRISGTF